jgi:hypothetical protein
MVLIAESTKIEPQWRAAWSQSPICPRCDACRAGRGASR